LKAAVCYEFGKPLVVEEVDIRPPNEGEIKIKMGATAICHSDIHDISGDLGGTVPFVGGHECAGYIDEVGKGVTQVKPGDHVVVSLLASCGKCRYCRMGLPHLCNASFPLDKQSPIRNKKGQYLRQMVRIGGFAEYAIITESQAVLIPDDLPMDRASLLACGVTTGFGAVVNRARVEVLSSCVIIGTGGVGLNAVQGAAISGAYPIIAVDISDKKLKAARTFGATHTINSTKKDAIKEVQALTGGFGADYVFVTVGNVAMIQQGFMMSGPRGMTVIVGLPKITDMLNISPFGFIKDERVITGGYMGSTRIQVDIPRMVDLYKAGILKLDELITGHYSLDQINQGIDSVLKGEALRNIIMFE